MDLYPDEEFSGLDVWPKKADMDLEITFSSSEEIVSIARSAHREDWGEHCRQIADNILTRSVSPGGRQITIRVGDLITMRYAAEIGACYEASDALTAIIEDCAEMARVEGKQS